MLSLFAGAPAAHAQLGTCPNTSFDIVDQSDADIGRYVGNARVGSHGKLVVYECGDEICLVDFKETPPLRETIPLPDGSRFLSHPDIARTVSKTYVLYTIRTTGSPDSELLYVYNRKEGTSELVTVDMNGEPAFGRYYGFASIALAGSQPIVAFSSFNDNLVPGDNNDDGDVFIRNLETDSTTLVSKSTSGEQGNGMSGYGNRVSVGNGLSGPVVTFYSEATNLVHDDTNDAPDIFIHRLDSGTTKRVSLRPDGGELYYGAEVSTMDNKGDFVVFSAEPDPDEYRGLFIWDADTAQIKRVSVPKDGGSNEAHSPYNDEFLTIRQQGRFVFFSSRDDNLVPGDNNGDTTAGEDIFARDVVNGTTRLLSYIPDSNGNCERARLVGRVDAAQISQHIVYEVDGTIYRSGVDVRGPLIRFADVSPEIGKTSDTFSFSAEIWDQNPGPDTEFRVDDGEWLPATQKPLSRFGITFSGQFSGVGLEVGLRQLCIRSRDLQDNENEACQNFSIVAQRPIALFSVRCSHSPLLPEPGENVTYTAEAFDKDGYPLAVDAIEIWTGGSNTPALQIGNGSQAGWIAQASGESDTYGCRAVHNGESNFSGWRLHANEGYDDSRAIPLIKTGEPDSRIDIVFIADSDDYIDPLGPAFLADIETMLINGYWSQAWFRDNQVWFNFWLSRDRGLATRDDAENCDHRLPGMADDDSPEEATLWDEHYAFSDSGAILHTKTLRDCAKGGLGVFSAIVSNPRVIVHESGHRPFGLADEYCCDGGNYQRSTLPNLWASLAACQADLPNLIDPNNQCMSFLNVDDETWWTSDPNIDHLMTDNRTPRAADIRRMNWVIRRCMNGDC